MALIRKLLWFAVFVISTLSFVVLFEHGTVKFADNLKKELIDFTAFVKEEITPPKPETPTP